MSTVNIEFGYLMPRGLPRLRQKISRMLRGKRGQKNRKAPPVSKAPPRLGPIGNVAQPNSLSDLVSINFDNGSFEKLNLTFDIEDSTFFGAREIKSPRVTTAAQAPKPSDKMQSQDPTALGKRAPLALQSPNGKIREPTNRLSQNFQSGQKTAFEQPKASPLKIWSTQSISVESTSAPIAKTYSAKRKADESTPFSPPKMSKPAEWRQSSIAEQRKSAASTARWSIYSTEQKPAASIERNTSAPVAKHRPISYLDHESTFSAEEVQDQDLLRYSGTSTVEAQKVEYKKPTYAPKLVNSETASLASKEATPPMPSKRFEVKTDSLLKPVTSNDKTARQVSETIGRINSNTIGASVPPLESGKAPQKPDDERASRRLSQTSVRMNLFEARSQTPDYAPRPREPRASSRVSERMSWHKDFEDATKNPGRDFVFKKLEGGVAAKLAQLEGKQPPGGLSRSNSTVSRSSDMYSIEAGNSRIARRGTLEGESRPGNISNVVDGSFKQKLENVTGNIAERVQKASSSDLRGLGILTTKNAVGVPQDVLDLIALSGVDQEAAINEYLQRNKLGKTKTWDLDEVQKQIKEADDLVFSGEKKDAAPPIAKAVQPANDGSPKSAPVTKNDAVSSSKKEVVAQAPQRAVSGLTSEALRLSAVDEKKRFQVDHIEDIKTPSSSSSPTNQFVGDLAETSKASNQDSAKVHTAVQEPAKNGKAISSPSTASTQTPAFNAAALPQF